VAILVEISLSDWDFMLVHPYDVTEIADSNFFDS